MYNFQYVHKNEWKEVKDNLEEIISKVQNKVKSHFTFQFSFIGSSSRNMITCDFSQNVGYDFDVDIVVNDDDEKYDAKKIKHILMNAFQKIILSYGYDYCEDSTKVFTIKVKDKEKSKILHSADFAIVRHRRKKTQYIRHNKGQGSYNWADKSGGYHTLPDKEYYLKGCGCWNEVRDRYLEKKNENYSNKKSCSLYAETINDLYNQYRQ